MTGRYSPNLLEDLTMLPKLSDRVGFKLYEGLRTAYREECWMQVGPEVWDQVWFGVAEQISLHVTYRGQRE